MNHVKIHTTRNEYTRLYTSTCDVWGQHISGTGPTRRTAITLCRAKATEYAQQLLGCAQAL